MDTPSPTIDSARYSEVTDLGGGKWRRFFMWNNKITKFEFNMPFDDGHYTTTVTKEGDNKWVFNSKSKVAGLPDRRWTWVFYNAGLEEEVKKRGSVTSKQFYQRK